MVTWLAERAEESERAASLIRRGKGWLEILQRQASPSDSCACGVPSGMSSPLQLCARRPDRRKWAGSQARASFAPLLRRERAGGAGSQGRERRPARGGVPGRRSLLRLGASTRPPPEHPHALTLHLATPRRSRSRRVTRGALTPRPADGRWRHHPPVPPGDGGHPRAAAGVPGGRPRVEGVALRLHHVPPDAPLPGHLPGEACHRCVGFFQLARRPAPWRAAFGSVAGGATGLTREGDRSTLLRRPAQSWGRAAVSAGCSLRVSGRLRA